MNKQIYRKKN